MSRFKDVSKTSKLKEKYLTKGDIKAIVEYKKAMDENDTIVTCMGLYNHGKSTLLNALIDDYENKTFKAADVRETTKNKSVKHGDLTIVDTPGLNAQKNDDKRVMDAVKESDINIFVHNVNTGAFVESEIEFFHNVKKHWKNPQEFIERTIFVLSKKDEVNSLDDIKNTHIEMLRQINKVFKVKANIIAVSAKDYSDGKIENEQELVDEGNIDSLNNEIHTLSKNIKNKLIKTKQKRLLNCYKNNINNLYNKLEKLKMTRSQLINESKKRNNNLYDDISKISGTLRHKDKILERIS